MGTHKRPYDGGLKILRGVGGRFGLYCPEDSRAVRKSLERSITQVYAEVVAMNGNGELFVVERVLVDLTKMEIIE